MNRLYTDLGYKPLNRTWAKIEIWLGLLAAGCGLGLEMWQLSRPMAEIDWRLTLAGLGLFVLGIYLAMAGNRSHLYKSNNEQTALLLDEIRRLRKEG